MTKRPDDQTTILRTPEKTARELFREFLGHLAPRRRKQLVLLLLLMLVGSFAEVVTIGAVVPFISLMARPETAMEYPILQNLFAALGWRQPESLMLPMTISFVGIVLVATGIRLLLLYASNKLVFAIGHDIGVKLYTVILYQPYAFHISRNTSDVIGNVNKVQIVLGAFLRPIMQGIIAVVLALAILTALLLVDAFTALSAGLLFAVVYLVIMRLFRTRLRLNGKIIAAAQGRRVQCIQEGLGGIRDVILDASQTQYTSEFSRIDRRFRNAQARNAFLGASPRFLVEAIGVIVIVALAFSLSLKQGGLLIALPILAALALGAQRLMPLIQKIYTAWAQSTGNRQAFEDVLAILNLPRAQIGTTRKGELPKFNKEIELSDISFRYHADGEDVLRSVNLTIPRGTRVGVVGKTGSGKSTLLDIIMGLLHPTSGELRVDGVSIGAGNRVRWQQCIAHVPQHIYLSDASVAENIALGDNSDNIDIDRVRNAAHQAQIGSFIESTRQGYHTRVGERGVQLSGGQRQRIGIARALYKQADVLVLDEASSALDMETESAVMEAVANLDPELTLFIIAHRVQTLHDCDLIVRLDEGRVDATGSFDNVVAKSGHA